ncbi:MAG: hypothetical protein F4Y02_06625 [Chloroflexi bacterium]|nr:hypothetical protein [Chloroflexota bacterium]
MATFLELCQAVAAESGTIHGVQPATTTGQTDRLGLIVGWVRQAWVDIQNSADWRFLYRDFTQAGVVRLVQGQRTYTGKLLRSDFARWVLADPLNGTGMTADPGERGDRSGEFELFPMDYEAYRRTHQFVVGDEQGVPRNVAVNYENDLVVGPIPDRTYVLRGPYVRAPQMLGKDADGNDLSQPDEDVPIMPAQYHEAIKWKALRLLGEFDEADTLVLQTADINYRSYASAMRRDLLRRGGPYIDTEGGLGGSLGGRSFGTGVFGPPPTAGFGA